MLTKVQATYINGMFRPEAKIDLPDGAEVELQINPVPQANPTLNWASLAGIWSKLSEAELTGLQARLTRLRQTSTYKMSQLAHQLRENTETPND